MTRLKGAIIVIAFLIAASVFSFVILTGGSQSYASVPPAIILPTPSSTMKIVSVYAYQDPSNSSQVSALAIIVQPSGTNSTDFTQGEITISLTTPTTSYANVYTTSDFVNASTFNNTCGGSFKNYQSIAPNCSIIELNGNGSQILEPGDTFAVFISLGQLNCTLQPYDQVTVVLTPSVGAELTCTYSIPANITQ